jgi:hypothetical protein
LINNQNILTSIPLLNTVTDKNSAPFKPLLENSFNEYKQALVGGKDFFNLPLLLGVKNLLLTSGTNKLKSDQVSEDLIDILAQTSDN